MNLLTQMFIQSKVKSDFSFIHGSNYFCTFHLHHEITYDDYCYMKAQITFLIPGEESLDFLINQTDSQNEKDQVIPPFWNQ